MENDNSVLTDEQLAKFQEIAKKRRDSRAGNISKYSVYTHFVRLKLASRQIMTYQWLI